MIVGARHGNGASGVDYVRARLGKVDESRSRDLREVLGLRGPGPVPSSPPVAMCMHPNCERSRAPNGGLCHMHAQRRARGGDMGAPVGAAPFDSPWHRLTEAALRFAHAPTGSGRSERDALRSAARSFAASHEAEPFRFGDKTTRADVEAAALEYAAAESDGEFAEASEKLRRAAARIARPVARKWAAVPAELAAAIVEERARTGRSTRSLALTFGVGQPTISRILARARGAPPRTRRRAA